MQSLADRFAETFTEWPHLKARNFCGIREDLAPEELVADLHHW